MILVKDVHPALGYSGTVKNFRENYLAILLIVSQLKEKKQC
jgi:hypothetical protein